MCARFSQSGWTRELLGYNPAFSSPTLNHHIYIFPSPMAIRETGLHSWKGILVDPLLWFHIRVLHAVRKGYCCLISSHYPPSPTPCRAWFYRGLILLLLLHLHILRSRRQWQPVERNPLPHSLLPLGRTLGEARDDGAGVLGLVGPLLHHGHQLEGSARAKFLLAECGVVAWEGGVVEGGSYDLANRARKGSIDRDGRLRGAHVEGFRTMAEAREDYRLLQGTDLIRMAPETPLGSS